MSQQQDNSSTSPSNKSGATTTTEPWTLENSSLWWLSLDFFQHPGNVLLLSSIPFCAGATYGYFQTGERIEEWVGERTPGKVARQVPSSPAAKQLGVQMAARALGLATMGTVGAFGVLGAAGFYAAGYRSVDEALTSTGAWASHQRESFENWLGMDDRESKTHPDVLATKNMTEEEEVNYVYQQLLQEVEQTPDGKE